jgi:hypothetical protein
MLAKAKLASSITFIELASFTIVTYDRQNMFIIQATACTGREKKAQTSHFINLAFHQQTKLFSIRETLQNGKA